MNVLSVASMIVYEDPELIVCHKPAGLAVQTARLGDMDLENGLKSYLAETQQRQMPYLAVVHRLDQPVEGLLVFAKTPRAAKELNNQLTAGKIQKRYLAVTDHCPKDTDGTLTDYLRKDGKTHISSVVQKNTPGAKLCRLSYRLTEKIPDPRVEGGVRYLLQIQLDTGRHHQIRVQMCHAGMPLVGDRKYYPGDRSGLPLGLCAAVLEFCHPVTGKRLQFQIVPEGACFQGGR